MAPISLNKPLRSLSLAVLLLAASSPARGEEIFSARLLAPEPTWQATRGAFAAVGIGLAPSLGNPAAFGLSGEGLVRVAVSHLAWSSGVSREWGMLGWRAGRWSGGLDAAMLRSPELPGYTAEGLETESFRPSEWDGGGSVGFRALGALSVGLGGRVLRLEDPDEPVTAWTGSLGMLWQGESRSVGLSVVDLGPAVETSHGSWDPPARWRAGFAQSVFAHAATFGLSFAGDAAEGSGDATVGMIVRPAGRLELLGGFSLVRPEELEGPGWSAGAAWGQGALKVSYGVADDGALGLTHQFGLGLALATRR